MKIKIVWTINYETICKFLYFKQICPRFFKQLSNKFEIMDFQYFLTTVRITNEVILYVTFLSLNTENIKFYLT